MSAATISFDTDLYDKPAVDEALTAFGDFADITLAAQDAHWVVTVTTSEGAEYPAETLAAELGNYALVQTIHRKR